MDAKPSVFCDTLYHQKNFVYNSKVKNKTNFQLTGVLLQTYNSAILNPDLKQCLKSWRSGEDITFNTLENVKEVPLKHREKMVN